MEENNVVLLLNLGDSSAFIKADWSDFGLESSRTATVRDLWKHEDVGETEESISFVVASHGVKMYKISPV